MSNKLNIAIVGCGRVVGHHVKAINNHPKLSLSSVCDLRKDRLADMQGIEGVPQFFNYHEMFLKHPEIDVVAIITPSGMHFEHAFDAINEYGKSVVIEKPVVMNMSDGDKLAEAASIKDVQIFPVHQYRFNRCVQRIRAAIKNDELGEIVLATIRLRWCRPQRYYDRDPWRGTFSLDGGCCTNQGIHHLDMLRYFVGEAKRVNSVMRTYAVNVEVEDTMVATVEFECGALGVFEITTAARPDDFESSISIVGSKGLAMLGGWATDKLLTFSVKPEDEEEYSDTFKDAYGLGHNEIYAGVYDTLTNDGNPAVSFDDAMGTIKLLQAVYLSDERQDWVNVEECVESNRLGRKDEELAALYRTSKEIN